MVTREQYVADLRRRHSNIYSPTMSDELVYYMGRKSDPYADVEDWEEMGYVGSKKQYKPVADISPSGWNELIVKDINDDSWEWVKHAYANSLQGTLDAWYNGNLDYDIKKDYDELNVGEKILAGVGSFMMPLDLLTLYVGAPLATKGIMALGSKAGGKKLAETAAVKGLLAKANTLGQKYGLGDGVLNASLKNSIMGGNVLGMYEGAKGALQADLAGEDVFEGTAEGYVHGAILGAAMGGIGGAMEGNFLRYKALKEARLGGDEVFKAGFKRNYALPEIEKMLKFTGKGAQYAAEVGVLETASLIDIAKNGELKADKLLEDLIVNVGFVGLMKGKRKLLPKTLEPLKELSENLKNKYGKTRADNKAKEDPTVDRPFDPKQEVGSEIEDIIKSEEGKATIQGDKNASVLKEGLDGVKENLKVETESDIAKQFIKVDGLIKRLEYHEQRAKEVDTIKDVKVQREKVKELANELLEARGWTQRGVEDGTLGKHWIPKMRELDLRAEQVDKDLIGRKTVADNDFARQKEKARANFSQEDPGTRRSPEEFKKTILSDLEMMKVYNEEQAGAQTRASETTADVILRKTGGADIERQRAKVAGIKGAIEALEKPVKKDFELDEKFDDAKKTYNDKQVALKRLTQYKDKIYDDDLNALFQYASEGGLKTGYSKTVGDFLEWVKKPENGDKSWADVTKQDVYDYNNKVVLKRAKKNKLTSKDMNPFATFGRWSNGKWTNKNVVEGLSFTEANEARFKPVVEREIESSALDAITSEKIESARKVSGDAGVVLTELAKFGLRRQEANKFRLSDIKKEKGGRERYYIDTDKIKKKGTQTRPVVIPKSLATKLFALNGLELADIGKIPKDQNRVLFGGKKIEKTVDGKKKQKGILQEVAEHIWGEGANYRDSRNILSQLGLKAKSFTPEEVGFLIGDVQGDVSKIYQMGKLPLSEKLDIVEKVFLSTGVLGKGELPAAPKVTVKMPAPPMTERDIAIGYIQESITPHKDVNLARKFGESKKQQKQKIADKEVIIAALKGAPESAGYKTAAKQAIDSFIKTHVEAIERIKADPSILKKNPNLGDIPHHKKWIKRYTDTRKLLDKTPDELEYGTYAGPGQRAKLVKIAKTIQDKIGIAKGEEQLSEEAYKKQLFDETKDLLGKGVTSIGASAKPSLSPEDLVAYINFIGSSEYLSAPKRWRARQKVVNDMARDYDVPKSDITELLRDVLGVKDGKWENVKSKETIDYVISWISGFERTKFPPSTTDVIFEGLTGGLGPFPKHTRLSFTSPGQILQNPKFGKMVGEEIIAPLNDIPVTEIALRGRSSEDSRNIKKLLPGDEANKMFVLTQPEVQRAWKDDLSPDYIKSIERLQDPTSNEAKAVAIWDKQASDYWKLWSKYGEEHTNRHMAEELENLLGKKFVDNYFLRKVNPDALEALGSTKQLVGLDEYSKIIDLNISKVIKPKIKEMEKGKGKGVEKGETEDQFRDRKKDEAKRLRTDETTIHEAKQLILNFLEMKHHDLKNPAFMERGVLLPRHITIKDSKGKIKKINSYLEDWAESGEHYGISQARQLAIFRHLPEFTKLGKQLKIGNYKENIFDILRSTEKMKGKGVSKDWANYIGTWLEAELNMQGSFKEAHMKKIHRYGGILASTGSGLGLSTPVVHAVKNLAMAFPKSVGDKNFTTSIQGWIKNFDQQARKKGREKGYGDFFSQNVLRPQKNIIEEMGWTKKLPWGIGKNFTMDRLFEWNWMKPTESITRIGDSYASNLYFGQMLDAYKGKKNSFWMGQEKVNKQFEFSAKNQWKLAPNERAFLKETLYEDLYAENKTSPHIKGKASNAIMMDWIMNKVEFYGQASSQGGTRPIMLPLWMSQPAWKPLTLFARIGTSVTSSIWTNQIRPIWEVGNPMPFVRYAATTAFTGAGLYSFYKYILGQDQMHEMSDDKWKTVMQWLWRAEFLGMFSNIFNPHMSPIYGSNADAKLGVDPSFVTDFFEPYMIRSGRAITEGIATVMTDPTNPKGWGQAVKHVTKSSVSVVGQTARQWDRLFYPETQEWNKFRTAARSFKKEKGYATPQFKLKTARQIYYSDLKNEFWRGNEKDFAKAYYAALAQIDSELAVGGIISPALRRKEAMRNIEQSLKSMNPVNFSVDIKGREMSKKNEFLNYLKNYDENVYRQALKSEREFGFKLRKLIAATRKSEYKLRYSPYYDRY